MHYVSELPVVVGEFDADALHARIDAFEADPAYGEYPESMSTLLRDSATSIADTLNIEWDSVNPDDYDALFAEYIQYYAPRVKITWEVDSWHPDFMKKRYKSRRQVLAETIAGASRWPTQYLVGNVAVASLDLARNLGLVKYWRHDASQAACQEAIERGNAHEVKFAPGEIVRSRGTIHRRDIPAGAEGYRYYFRKFNKNREQTHRDRLVTQLRLR